MALAIAEAVQPVRRAIERRLLHERLITWGLGQLPWSRTEFDMARIRRECAEILAAADKERFTTESQSFFEYPKYQLLRAL